MAKAMSSQERVRTAIGRKVPDRVPVQDGPWAATVDRWKTEGFPSRTSPAEYFGYDIVTIGADLSPRFTPRVLSEDAEYVVERTSTGGIRRNHRDYSTTPDVVDCAIKKKDDWPPIRDRLTPDFKRVDWASAHATYQRAREDGKYVAFAAACGYDLLQAYVRSEELLVHMIEDPGFVKEMVDVTSELIVQTAITLHREGFRFDGSWVYDDMGYRNTSLFSPELYRQIIGPADTRRNQVFHELGMQTILHSCGCVKGLIPSIIDAGFDCLQPLEVKAGMDLTQLKPAYGDRIAFFGGINTLLMEDPDDSKIEEEIARKFAVAKKGGGYLYHSDHSIPLDVSLAKYRFVLECVHRYGAY